MVAPFAFHQLETTVVWPPAVGSVGVTEAGKAAFQNQGVLLLSNPRLGKWIGIERIRAGWLEGRLTDWLLSPPWHRRLHWILVRRSPYNMNWWWQWWSWWPCHQNHLNLLWGSPTFYHGRLLKEKLEVPKVSWASTKPPRHKVVTVTIIVVITNIISVVRISPFKITIWQLTTSSYGKTLKDAPAWLTATEFIDCPEVLKTKVLHI